MSGVAVGARIGTYRLLQVIGDGGLGPVYRAVEEGSGREAAFRVFARDVSGDALLADRLRSMTPALRKLHHQNIGGVYELVTVGADLALFLEYVAGTPLERVRGVPGRLDTKASVSCAIQVLRALEVAHGRGVLHHALRPTNVMVTPGGGVKVMDFGIGHAFGANRKTREDRLLGVLAYLAPEQIQNQPGDARSDLYAVGVILYELLTGRRPFDHRTEFALRQAQLNEPPASPRFHVPDLPEWLDQAILRSLSKHPAARYQNATEFRAVLEAALGLTTSREAAALRAHGGAAGGAFGAAPPIPVPQAGVGRASGSYTAEPVQVQPTAEGTGVSRSGAHRFAGPTPSSPPPASRTSSDAWGPTPAPGAHRQHDYIPATFRAPGAAPAESSPADAGHPAPARQAARVVAALAVVLGVAAAGAYCWKRSAPPEAPTAAAQPAARPEKALPPPAPPVQLPERRADEIASADVKPVPAPKPRAKPPLEAKPLPSAAHITPLADDGRAGAAEGRAGGAVPDPSRELSFHGVRLVTPAAGDDQQESGVVLVFGHDRMSVTPDGGGAALRSVRYRDITAASYSPVERKRLGLISSTRHLLTIETRGDPLLLRLDGDRVGPVLDALEARWGKAVNR